VSFLRWMKFWLRLAPLFLVAAVSAKAAQHLYARGCMLAWPVPTVSSEDANWRCEACIAERKAEVEAKAQEYQRVMAVFAAQEQAERQKREAAAAQNKADVVALQQTVAATPAPVASPEPGAAVEKFDIKDETYYGIHAVPGVNVVGVYTPMEQFADDHFGSLALKADGTGVFKEYNGDTRPLKWWVQARPNGLPKVAAEQAGEFKTLYLIVQYQTAAYTTIRGERVEVSPAGDYDIKYLIIHYNDHRIVYMGTYAKPL
jgi:hypothetical protein